MGKIFDGKRILVLGASSYIGVSFQEYLKKYAKDRLSADSVSLRGDDWKHTDWSVYDSIINVTGRAHADTGTLTPEEKRKIKDHVRENKPGIMSGLSAQIAEKTQTAVNRIYDTMLENTDRSLDAYMEGLMPYFVRSAAERRAFGEDKAQPEEGSGKAPWERAAERDAARSPQKGEAGAAERDSQCQE